MKRPVAIVAAVLLAAAGAAAQTAPRPGIAVTADGNSGGAGAAINAYRTEAGRKALVASGRLRTAAARHAADMARGGFVSHVGSDGSRLRERVRRAGYRMCFAAENIAWGQRDLGGVMARWHGSAGHRRNLLDGRARHFGLARSGAIWVLVIAAPC